MCVCVVVVVVGRVGGFFDGGVLGAVDGFQLLVAAPEG